MRYWLGYLRRSDLPWGQRLGISSAALIGPWFWPAWYLAPRWKRDQWSRIAGDDA